MEIVSNSIEDSIDWPQTNQNVVLSSSGCIVDQAANLSSYVMKRFSIEFIVFKLVQAHV